MRSTIVIVLGAGLQVFTEHAGAQTACELGTQTASWRGSTLQPLTAGASVGVQWVATDSAITLIPAPACGDAIVQFPEACDDGNLRNNDGCSASCAVERLCGNAVLNAGEQCDDGNAWSGDGCDSECFNELGCGNGILQSGEQCDDGNTWSGDGCDDNCMRESTPVCGNGQVQSGEGCDDGNARSGDGCSATCQIETCGSPCSQEGQVDSYFAGLNGPAGPYVGNRRCERAAWGALCWNYQFHFIGETCSYVSGSSFPEGPDSNPACLDRCPAGGFSTWHAGGLHGCGWAYCSAGGVVTGETAAGSSCPAQVGGGTCRLSSAVYSCQL